MFLIQKIGLRPSFRIELEMNVACFQNQGLHVLVVQK